MSKTFDQGRNEAAKLCQYFGTNQQSFLAPGVKEAHVRQSLIDPFFEALGWDVRNASMAAPQYREVIPEDSLDVEGQQKAPDYTFRVGTLPKFYVEAKKCGVNISADPMPAYQLRRYGFSAKLALSILTDFEELGVYDCASRPRPSDKASHARIQYFRFTEYPDRWQEIWDVFSREAVWSGAFDQYAASKRKRGTSEVDNEFLKDIEGWRDVLARNLALRNGDLSVDDLNAAVQRIIDRIVFLRMAEDRGLESYGQLLALCDRPDIYVRFMRELCRKADQKYNSGLFHFQKEPGVSDVPDTLTPRLVVDDHALKPILHSLYFEHGSPYNFGVMPVEILGTVYERFLGKVIRLTAGHQAKVEDKPEVRKAGGVYYTPAYIVNYIVHNTIGKQIEGKSPADLAGGKTTPPFRVLDMACGSGSFLLGAYQFLLDHCLMWHHANPSPKHAKTVYRNAKGETRLTISERKRILNTHIYGVDIDQQAVETTKLSLLLKALEGETDVTLSQQLTLFHDRALPNLSQNIKRGNSLVASDFSMVPEDLIRVHAFDWLAQFPDAMNAGGFDAIIGNPPWLMAGYYLERELSYLRAAYRSAVGKFDLYYCFIEKGTSLLRPNGESGMIVPNKFLHTKAAAGLRRLLLEQSRIRQILDFGDAQLFDGTTNYSAILLIGADKQSHFQYMRMSPSLEAKETVDVEFSRLGDSDAWTLAAERMARLFEKLHGCSVELESLTSRFGTGTQTGADKVLTLPRVEKHLFESRLLRPILRGRDVKRCHLADDTKLAIFPYAERKGAFTLLSDAELRTSPKVYEHLRAHRDKLDSRVWFGKTATQLSGAWFGYVYLDKWEAFERPHILTPSLTDRANYALGSGDLFLTGTAGVTSIIFKPDLKEDIKYWLALLNSKLLERYALEHSPPFSGGFFKFSAPYLKKLPMRRIDFTKPVDRQRHDRMVVLVDKMLALMPTLRAATAESEGAALQNAVTATESEIDHLVYELYGLTKEEVKALEGGR